MNEKLQMIEEQRFEHCMELYASSPLTNFLFTSQNKTKI